MSFSLPMYCIYDNTWPFPTNSISFLAWKVWSLSPLCPRPNGCNHLIIMKGKRRTMYMIMNAIGGQVWLAWHWRQRLAAIKRSDYARLLIQPTKLAKKVFVSSSNWKTISFLFFLFLLCLSKSFFFSAAAAHYMTIYSGETLKKSYVDKIERGCRAWIMGTPLSLGWLHSTRRLQSFSRVEFRWSSGRLIFQGRDLLGANTLLGGYKFNLLLHEML